MKERKKEGEEDRERKVGEGRKERKKKGKRKGRKKWARVNGLPCDCHHGPDSTLFISYPPHQEYTRSIISVSTFHRQGWRGTEGLIFFMLSPLAEPFALSCQAHCWCHSSPWTTFRSLRWAQIKTKNAWLRFNPPLVVLDLLSLESEVGLIGHQPPFTCNHIATHTISKSPLEAAHEPQLRWAIFSWMVLPEPVESSESVHFPPDQEN